MSETFIKVDVICDRDMVNYDCTNNGVTSCKRGEMIFVKVLGGDTPGNFTREQIEELGGFILEIKDRGPNIRPNFIPEGDDRWLMFGGNYISGDSRFNRSYGPYPVPVHDRYEG